VVTNGVTRCDLTADTMGKEDLDLAAPKARSEIVAAVWVAASGSQQAGRWLRERVVGCSRRLAFGGAGVQWSRAESELASYRERHGCAMSLKPSAALPRRGRGAGCGAAGRGSSSIELTCFRVRVGASVAFTVDGCQAPRQGSRASLVPRIHRVRWC
jgi:hypothetical protein